MTPRNAYFGGSELGIIDEKEKVIHLVDSRACAGRLLRGIEEYVRQSRHADVDVRVYGVRSWGRVVSWTLCRI